VNWIQPTKPLEGQVSAEGANFVEQIVSVGANGMVTAVGLYDPSTGDVIQDTGYPAGTTSLTLADWLAKCQ
jgi:hypothetical protein